MRKVLRVRVLVLRVNNNEKWFRMAANAARAHANVVPVVATFIAIMCRQMNEPIESERAREEGERSAHLHEHFE